MRAAIAVLAACTTATSPVNLRPPVVHEPARSGFRVHRSVIPGGVRAIATNGSTVVVLSYDDVLYGMTATGARVFRRRLAVPGATVELDMIDDVVVVATSDVVLGLAAATGRVRWRRRAEGNDTLATSIVHGNVWIDGDGASYTVVAHTGAEVARHAPPAPATVIEVTHTGDRIQLVATAHGRERWRTEHDRAYATIVSYLELGDATVFARASATGSTVVAVDSTTGRARWALELDADHIFHWAYRGGGLFWIVTDDATAIREGSIGYRWIAVSDTGAIVEQLDTPAPRALRCGGNVNWASAGGVLAVTSPTATAGGCGRETLEILAPSR